MSIRPIIEIQVIKNQKKQITQNNKKRYLKRVNSLDPDHDLDMEGKLLNNHHFILIHILYQAVLLMTSLLIFHIAFTFALTVHKYVNSNANPISRIYVWGLACYGALGNPDLIIPKKARTNISDSMHKPIR